MPTHNTGVADEVTSESAISRARFKGDGQVRYALAWRSPQHHIRAPKRRTYSQRNWLQFIIGRNTGPSCSRRNRVASIDCQDCIIGLPPNVVDEWTPSRLHAGGRSLFGAKSSAAKLGLRSSAWSRKIPILHVIETGDHRFQLAHSTYSVDRRRL